VFFLFSSNFLNIHISILIIKTDVLGFQVGAGIRTDASARAEHPSVVIVIREAGYQYIDI